MSSPRYYDDGSFKAPVQNGPISYAHPFADKGDSITFLATITFRQDARYFGIQGFVNLTLIRVFPAGIAYRVNISEASNVDCGILEWTETYASIPVTRTEYGSISYTQQFVTLASVANGTELGVIEWTNTRDAAVTYEYSLGSPLPRKLSPKVIQIGQNVYTEGGFGTFSEGQSILAKDTESEIWMGRIYCRKSTVISYHQFVQFV